VEISEQRLPMEVSREQREARSSFLCLSSDDPTDDISVVVGYLVLAGAIAILIPQCCHSGSPGPMLVPVAYCGGMLFLAAFVIFLKSDVWPWMCCVDLMRI
jgi:hypothetical protein